MFDAERIEASMRVCDAATQGGWKAGVMRPVDPGRHATPEELKADLCDLVDNSVAFDGADRDCYMAWVPNTDVDAGKHGHLSVAICGAGPTSEANVVFIALARTELPEALVEVARLRAALEEIEKAHSYPASIGLDPYRTHVIASKALES